MKIHIRYRAGDDPSVVHIEKYAADYNLTELVLPARARNVFEVPRDHRLLYIVGYCHFYDNTLFYFPVEIITLIRYNKLYIFVAEDRIKWKTM